MPNLQIRVWGPPVYTSGINARERAGRGGLRRDPGLYLSVYQWRVPFVFRASALSTVSQGGGGDDDDGGAGIKETNPVCETI